LTDTYLLVDTNSYLFSLRNLTRLGRVLLDLQPLDWLKPTPVDFHGKPRFLLWTFFKNRTL